MTTSRKNLSHDQFCSWLVLEGYKCWRNPDMPGMEWLQYDELHHVYRKFDPDHERYDLHEYEIGLWFEAPEGVLPFTVSELSTDQTSGMQKAMKKAKIL